MLGVERGASHKEGLHPEQGGDGGGSSQKTSTKEALAQQQGSRASASALHLDAKTSLSVHRSAQPAILPFVQLLGSLRHPEGAVVFLVTPPTRSLDSQPPWSKPTCKIRASSATRWISGTG